MWRSIILGGLVAFGACAEAGRPDRPSVDIDAPLPMDSTTIDAPPNQVTLSQTTSDQLGAQNGFACVRGDGTTGDNAWYRVFRLADEGITGGLVINSVTFGVQQAVGMPTLTIRIGTFSGALTPPPTQLDTNLITPLATTTYAMQNVTQGAPQLITVPISTNAPALSQVVVEISTPDFQGQGKSFLIAGNAAGESAPVWLRSTACGSPQPRTLASLNATDAANAQLVIQVSGTYSQ